MKKNIHRLIKNPFIQGGVISMIGNVISSFINYFFNVTAGWVLGPAGFGEITTFFSYISLSGLPLQLIATLIIRKVSATDKVHQYSITRSIEQFYWKWWKYIGLTAVFITATVAPILPTITNLTPFVAYCIIPIFLLSLISIIYSSFLQALRMFSIAVIIGVGAVCIKLLGVGAVAVGIDGISTVAFFFLLSYTVSVFFTWVAYKKKSANQPLFSDKIQTWNVGKLVAKRSVIITFFSTVFITLYANVDLIFARRMLSPETAGLYAAWILYGKILLYAVGPLISIAFVYFSGSENLSRQRRIMTTAVTAIFGGGVVLYMCYLFMPSFVVGMLFGPRFIKLEPLLSSAAIFGVFYTISFVFTQYFLAKKSGGVLILPILFPLYVALLYLHNESIVSYIQITTGIYMVITFIYGVFFLIRMRTHPAV